MNMMCQLCQKTVVNPVRVTEEHYIRFIRVAFKEFRPANSVCKRCYNTVRKTFKIKMDHRAKHRANKMNTVSSSSSLPSESLPLLPSSSSIQLRLQSDGGEGSDSSTSTSNGIVGVDTSSSIDFAPSTSKAAQAAAASKAQSKGAAAATKAQSKGAAARGAKQPIAIATAERRKRAPRTADDDDDDFMPSPNALNGTRLPDVQPIAKRRVHVNPRLEALNIYTHDIIGG